MIKNQTANSHTTFPPRVPLNQFTGSGPKSAMVAATEYSNAVTALPSQGRRTPRPRAASAFTLIEVLVVIALTVILLTVLFLPLIQAFNFTGEAQATAQAQDAARLTTEQLTRELSSAAAVRDTTGNFLDLPLDNSAGAQIIAHSYNAYIDIIPPRVQSGTIIDPTVNNQSPTSSVGGTSLSGVSTELSGGSVVLPLSAGSTVIRYFIGLRYPLDPKYVPAATMGGTDGTTPDNASDTTFAQPGDPQPYINRYDAVSVSSTDPHFSSYAAQQGLNNTYQLYRVDFQPYSLSGTGSSATYSVNKNLLDVTSTGAPILDDPDFFRIVLVGDKNLAQDSTGATLYTLVTAKEHNDRVYNWFKVAKEVISTRDIDLVGLPRVGGKIAYDKPAPAVGNPVDAYESDGTTPIVRTTINFAPALISDDPMAASNTSNQSQGYGESPNANISPLPYVPTLFQSQYGNWQGTPVVTINKSGTLYQTRKFTTADGSSYTLGSPNYSTTSATAPAVDDLILASGVTSSSPGTPVYDITQGAPILTGSASTSLVYDALTIDQNSGIVNFAIPALPNTSLPTNPYFTVNVPANGVINLNDQTQLPGSPLPPSSSTSSPAASVVPNATLVVNSERVIGPDLASGILSAAPSTDVVQYTRVSTDPPTSPDQYYVDYANDNIVFSPSAIPPSTSTVKVAFSYQNNLTTGWTQSGSSGGSTPDPYVNSGSTTQYVVDTLQSSYYSASIMRLNLGVRVYSSATSASQYFSLNSQVGVGNSKAN